MEEKVVDNGLIANSENVVQGATFRISVLTERLIRLEYHPNGIFNDFESTLVKFRNFPKVNFQKQEDGRYLVIRTKYFTLSYTKEKPFDAGKFMPMANLKVELTGTDSEGEEIDVNRVSTALRAAGVDLNEYLTGAKGLDEVFIELASKWDNLDLVT